MATALAHMPIALSEADYLAGEVLATVRHELVSGEVYAMAGASERRSRIALNIAFHLQGSHSRQDLQGLYGGHEAPPAARHLVLLPRCDAGVRPDGRSSAL